MDVEVKNFWKEKSNIINWKRKPKKIFTEKKNNKFTWYEDGILNIKSNCIDKNINDNLGEKYAIHYIDKQKNILSVKYKELNNLINNFSLFLKKINLKKNSKVLIHGSSSFETSISMLSCANLGYSHCVLFQELSKEAIEVRVDLIKPDIIISRSEQKEFDLKFKSILRKNKKIKFVSFSNKPVKNKKVFKINKNNFTKFKNFKVVKKTMNYYDSGKNFFTLFTSGSTGIPKGIMHSYGGYLVYSKLTCTKKFGFKKNSTILTASDAGWINGHTYALYGPLSIGSTTILLESPILLLDIIFLKRILNELKVTILYLPVTFIRMLKTVSGKKKIFSKYLKTLGSMGEPLAKNVGDWYSSFFCLKNKSIINTYYQTETAGIISSPSFNDKKHIIHGSVGKPLTRHLGVKMFSNKNSITNKGHIKVTNKWPGCMIDVINGVQEWNKYWDQNNNFNMFDTASIDKNKIIQIHGRTDDVINIRGHRIGSEEIESTLLKINLISECCAISVTDDLEGHKIIIFYSSKNRSDINSDIMIKKIEKVFGSFAIPEKIIRLESLPKTRSGKILRRLLRVLYENPEKYKKQDLSTMLNSNVIKEIINKIKTQ